MRLLLLTLFLVPLAANAHGDAPSLEAEVGGYLIDIGYEPDLAPKETIEFDFDLFRIGPPIDYADFASIDVRVTRNGAQVSSASVGNDESYRPVVGMAFDEPGGYDMDVRYLDVGGSLIVARTFHLEVPSDARVFVRGGLETAHYVIAAGLFALSLGIAAYSLWQRFGVAKK